MKKQILSLMLGAAVLATSPAFAMNSPCYRYSSEEDKERGHSVRQASITNNEEVEKKESSAASQENADRKAALLAAIPFTLDWEDLENHKRSYIAIVKELMQINSTSNDTTVLFPRREELKNLLKTENELRDKLMMQLGANEPVFTNASPAEVLKLSVESAIRSATLAVQHQYLLKKETNSAALSENDIPSLRDFGFLQRVSPAGERITDFVVTPAHPFVMQSQDREDGEGKRDHFQQNPVLAGSDKKSYNMSETKKKARSDRPGVRNSRARYSLWLDLEEGKGVVRQDDQSKITRAVVNTTVELEYVD